MLGTAEKPVTRLTGATWSVETRPWQRADNGGRRFQSATPERRLLERNREKRIFDTDRLEARHSIAQLDKPS